MTKILTVLDGFGLKPLDANNCNALAHMPNFRRLLAQYPWTTLETGGELVGQEAGLIGNSEVGHMNIGGLKLVPQLSYQITKSSDNGFDLDMLTAPDQLINPQDLMKKTFEEKSNSVVHLIGLFSTGTIHSDLRHWVGAIEAAGQAGASRIILHIISDGRDSDRQSLAKTWRVFIKAYKKDLEPFEHLIFLGSLGGRFYAMDRDNNWDRVAMGLIPLIDYKIIDENDTGGNVMITKYLENKYNIDITVKIAKLAEEIEKNNLPYDDKNPTRNNFYTDHFHCFFLDTDKKDRQSGQSQLEIDIDITIECFTRSHYRQQRYDEDLIPASMYYYDALYGVDAPITPSYVIKKNDNVWLINFRSDRMKQFISMLVDINSEFDLGLTVMTMSDYGGTPSSLSGEKVVLHPIFRSQPVQGTLAETISSRGQTQLHIAETEKYAHVTYFLNGGSDVKHTGEDWVLIPSNKVNSHSEKPEMKAKEITDYIIDKGMCKYDYIIVNYANPDMVGHTGDIEAGIKSMEFLDIQLGRLIDEVKKYNHSMVIISDHGNIEKVGPYMYHGQNLTDTEHNPSAVPMILVNCNLESTLKNAKERLPTELYEVLKNNLNLNNRVDLTKSETWLTAEQIPVPSLPLWVAGAVFMGM